MWLYLALALVAVAYLVYNSFKYDYWEKRGVPTVSGNEWFFGHLRPIFMVKKHLILVYQEMYKEFPDAPMIGYYAMNVPALLVRDLGMIKTILISEFGNFNFNGFAVDKKEDPLAAAHPFLLKGEEWKNSRNQVTPSLSLAKLKGYLPNIFKVGDEMVKYVKKNGTAELETRELAAMYSTDVVANAIYGVANNCFEDKDSLFVNLTKEIEFESSVSTNIKLFLQRIPIINWFFPARFSSKKLEDVMVALTSRVIKERVESGEKRNDLIQLLLTQKDNDTKGVYTDTYMSGQVFIVIADLYDTASTALSIILYTIARHPEIQEKLRDEIKEIISRNNGEVTVEDIEGAKYIGMVYNVYTDTYMSGQVFIVIADLYDTASTALSIILYTIARHPEIQEKLRDEIKEIISRNNGEVTVEDIEGAKYIGMVYNETFRLFSFVLSRECTVDCYIDMPGSQKPFKIRKGTPVIIPVNAIHKDPKYYPDPEKFDPERFTEEEVEKRPRFSYMPFGEGPKKCIGTRIVGLHVKAALIKILDNFKLTPSPKTKYPFEFDVRYQLTLRPKDGVWVNFEPIK